MVTSATWERRALFRNENWAKLFVRNLFECRAKGYALHEFVVMPDHFHAIISPIIALEHAVQFIKGGFSYRAKKELESNMEVWQRSFSDHRIHDRVDYEKHVVYVRENPVRARLVNRPEEYLFCSGFQGTNWLQCRSG
jgi:putative transposase